MESFKIRLLDKKDKPWVTAILTKNWASPRMVSRGKIFQADELPGFIAIQNGKPAGLITYLLDNGECEIGSISSEIEGIGIGFALIEAVKKAATKAGCHRLWLITTNDNTTALRFFQKRGLTLSAVYPSALERSRELKPEIPLLGNDGIPIRDEIELEMIL